MKNNLTEAESKTANEPIVIADECGDSLWDDVLQQQVKACTVVDVSKHAASLLNSIVAVQVSDTTEAK